MSASPIAFAAPIEPEDRVRADFYALFARLFFSAPDAGLLRTMGNAPLLSPDADSSALAIAWARLAAASRVMDVEAAEEEFEALFGGVGHSMISLFASFHASVDSPGVAGQFLVDLRTELSRMGLGLRTGQTIPEDHCAALFETMRLMIEGTDDTPPREDAEQRAFFKAFIAPWYRACCTATRNSSVANFYRTVAECCEAFLAIEDESLAIA